MRTLLRKFRFGCTEIFSNPPLLLLAELRAARHYSSRIPIPIRIIPCLEFAAKSSIPDALYFGPRAKNCIRELTNRSAIPVREKYSRGNCSNLILSLIK